MYIVKEKHYRPTYRKGDLEVEEVVSDVLSFKTRKAAKNFIESKLIGRSSVWRNYRRSPQTSFCGYRTGKTWIHENIGETCEDHNVSAYIDFDIIKTLVLSNMNKRLNELKEQFQNL